MEKIKFITFITLVSFLFLNCSGTKFLKFTNQNDEIYPSENLKNYLKQNKKPKVVLRVPRILNNEKGVVAEAEKYNYLYDVIEKELLKQGLIVRDRQLFNQVISNNDNTSDYSKLTEKTETDLIIELIKLDDKVDYQTNKYYTDKGANGVLSNMYKKYGATVEFKIVLMKTNEFAGTYTFNYSPCNLQNPCKIDDDFNRRWKDIERGKIPYESVYKNELEDFIRNATKQLVESMRN